MSAACRERLDLATIVDYWFGDLGTSDEERVELHLLECDACGEQVRDLLRTADGVKRLAGRGAFHLVVSAAFLESAARHGLRVRQYTVPAGGRVDCTVTRQDDLLVGRLQGDFRGVTRLDLTVRMGDGPEERVEDLPLSPSAGEVLVAQPMPLVRAMPSQVGTMRLFSHEPGGDRLLGEYTFNHTASDR